MKCNIFDLHIIKCKVCLRVFVFIIQKPVVVTGDDIYFIFFELFTNHCLGFGFRITLWLIGFFLLLIAPTSSDPHHHIKLSHMEIWRQTA